MFDSHLLEYSTIFELDYLIDDELDDRSITSKKGQYQGDELPNSKFSFRPQDINLITKHFLTDV